MAKAAGGVIYRSRALPLTVLRATRRSSLVRNSAYIMATTVVTSLTGYLYWIVAARSYSPNEVGLAAALVAGMVLASTVASVGLAATLVQMLPRRDAGYARSLTLNSALAAGGSAGALLGLVLVIAMPWVSSSFAVVRTDPVCGALLVVGVLLTTAGVLLDYTFIAERAAGNVLARNLVFSVLRVPLLLLPLAAITSTGAVTILAAWVISTAASVVTGVLLVPRLDRGYRSVIRGWAAHIGSMRSALAGHHLISLGGALPVYLLPLLVAGLLSPTDNAYFYTAWMVANVLFMVPAALSYSLFAEGSHAADRLRHHVRVSVLTTVGLLLPLIVLLLLTGRVIVGALGPEYPDHVVPVLTLLTLAAVPLAATSIYVSVLRVRERLRFAAGLSVGVAALTMGLAWVFISALGLIGVGWGVLVAEILGAAVVAVDLGRRRRGSRAARAGLPPAWARARPPGHD